MATSTKAKKLRLTEIKSQIREAYREAYARGNCWAYLTLHPDGSLLSGTEISPRHYCPNSDERLARPLPVILWSETAAVAADPSWGLFDMDSASSSEAEYWESADRRPTYRRERDEDHTVPVRMTDQLAADLDWDLILPEVIDRITAAGFGVDDDA